MRENLQNYVDFFNKTLNLSNICWWIIDFEENPEEYYCNDLMKDTFSLDKGLKWHSIEKTCPIAGDYFKNIESACKTNEHARIIIDEYTQLLEQEISEYNNHFPYYSEELDKTLYFSSRAKVLEFNEENKVSILYGIIEDITEQEEQKQKIEHLINVDKLTNIYNRHKIDSSLDIEIKKAKRYNNDLSLIIVDIDNFKQINDTYGHLKGDKIIFQIATLLKQNIREIDILGRWGGEEFIIISPNTNIEQAFHLAEKLRKLLENSKFYIEEKVTSSFGISEFTKEDNIESFINEADKALYKAKRNGKNKVEK